jgi:hypothetical protein
MSRSAAKTRLLDLKCDGGEFTLDGGLPTLTGRDGMPKNFFILGTCPARWHPDDSLWYKHFPKDRTGAAVMDSTPKGGTVFTCGSTDWEHGLRGNDPARRADHEEPARSTVEVTEVWACPMTKSAGAYPFLWETPQLD